jgi:dephospho-CoA kinase
MTQPLILGLTGSIAMGKSAVAQMFRDEGIPVFDADAAVHYMQGPSGALVAEIEAVFPGTTNDAGVDRLALGAAVFGDPKKLAALEAIVHPAVATMRNQFLIDAKTALIVVFDIPLLFEKGGHTSVDHIVVVSTSGVQQRARALARPGMTAQKFEGILNLQMPDAQKRVRGDTIIDTSGSLADTRAQVCALIKKLRSSLAVLDN